MSIGRTKKEMGGRKEENEESVVSHILMMRERLTKMSMLAGENLKQAQEKHKYWYDSGAKERTFEPGDKVLVLLLTATSKLLAQWQGPYFVKKQMGQVNYEIDMYDRRKRNRVFYINMLRKWNSPIESGLVVEEVSATQLEESEEVLTWKDGHLSKEEPIIGRSLTRRSWRIYGGSSRT